MASTGKAASAKRPSGRGRVERDARALEAEARRAERRAAFKGGARAAIVSRTVVYALVGALVIEVAVDNRAAAAPGTEGALQEISRQSGGPALLVLLAVGLAGYAGFRFVQALAGEAGGGRRAAWTRIGWLGSGVIYLALCAEAAVLVAGGSAGAGGAGGSGGSGGSGFDPRPVVAAVLRWPAGSAVVGLCGALVAGGGIALGVWGILHDYGKTLQRHQLSPSLFLVARVTGALGDVARGLLVVLAASYLLDSAATADPRQAKSMDGALRALLGVPGGRELLGALGSGLVLYALYSLIEARFRRI